MCKTHLEKWGGTVKQFWIFTGIIFLTLLIMFLLFSQVDWPIFQSPETFLQTQGIGTALTSIGLIVLDVFLPIPASLIMIVNGALFGVILGTIISLIGGVGAAITGFLLGKQSQHWGIERFVPEAQWRAAREMFMQWGMVAVIATRPVPLISETMVIVAGASGMSYKQLLIASFAGYLPIAVLYAVTGSMAVGFDSAVWSFGLVMVMATLFWLLRNPLNLLLTKQS